MAAPEDPRRIIQPGPGYAQLALVNDYQAPRSGQRELSASERSGEITDFRETNKLREISGGFALARSLARSLVRAHAAERTKIGTMKV